MNLYVYIKVGSFHLNAYHLTNTHMHCFAEKNSTIQTNKQTKKRLGPATEAMQKESSRLDRLSPWSPVPDLCLNESSVTRPTASAALLDAISADRPHGRGSTKERTFSLKKDETTCISTLHSPGPGWAQEIYTWL